MTPNVYMYLTGFDLEHSLLLVELQSLYSVQKGLSVHCQEKEIARQLAYFGFVMLG